LTTGDVLLTFIKTFVIIAFMTSYGFLFGLITYVIIEKAFKWCVAKYYGLRQLNGVD